MKDVAFIISIENKNDKNIHKTVESITNIMDSSSYTYTIYIIDGLNHYSNIKEALKHTDSKYIKILQSDDLLQSNFIKQLKYHKNTMYDVTCMNIISGYFYDTKTVYDKIEDITSSKLKDNTLLFTNKIKESFINLKVQTIVQDHNSLEYKKIQSVMSSGKHNGAYYYSKEIVESFIPQINTTYNWQTINHLNAPEHCIVFVHSNSTLDRYNYLLHKQDVILVCSTNHSVEVLKKKGHKYVIYVPLSVDTNYLDKFKSEKKEGTIACGNTWAFTPKQKQFFKENNIKHYYDLERTELLTLMGKAKTVYAIGRTAMEAIYLGANVIQPEKEYPVEKYTTYYTQQDAIRILQEELDKIKKEKETK